MSLYSQHAEYLHVDEDKRDFVVWKRISAVIPLEVNVLFQQEYFLSETPPSHTDLMVPPGHRQTVSDGQPVPVHLEVCGMTDRQTIAH